MPGNNPDTQSFFTASPVIPMPCATAALYTVSATLQTQNITPLSCSSLIPIATFPIPGTVKSPVLGFQNAFLTAEALVTESSILKTSPNLYLFQSQVSMP
jgi:hypothetical protein